MFVGASQRTAWFPGALGAIVSKHLKISQIFPIWNISLFVNSWGRPYVLWSLLHKVSSRYSETGTARAKSQHLGWVFSKPLTFFPSLSWLCAPRGCAHAHAYTHAQPHKHNHTITHTNTELYLEGKQYHTCCCWASWAQGPSRLEWKVLGSGSAELSPISSVCKWAGLLTS